MKHFYFAYGSNMCPTQMKERCPDHLIIGTAILENHELHFPRYADTRLGGVASIKASQQSIVYGVLYEISHLDKKSLDYHEDVPNSYVIETVSVFSNELKSKIEALTYIAVSEGQEFIPSMDYLETIERGIRSRKDIPENYINKIRASKKV
jgi:gamma-glutamylcyclotransferase